MFDESNFPYSRMFPTVPDPIPHLSQYFTLNPNLSSPHSHPISSSSDSPASNSASASTTEVSPAVSNSVVSPPLQCLPSPAPTRISHPMQTRFKSGIFKPKIHPSLLLYHSEPTYVKKGLQDPAWQEAMQHEHDALMNQKTWDLVSLPINNKVVGCKWIFRVKENVDGSINKYKARLVAKGFHHVAGFDFHETFSPISNLLPFASF